MSQSRIHCFLFCLLCCLLLMQGCADAQDWYEEPEAPDRPYVMLYQLSVDHYEIPAGTTYINELYCCKIGTLVIPASLTEWIEYIDHTYVKRYEVDPANPVFCSVDGVVFSKDMTELIAYPNNAEATAYTVPSGVRIIRKHAFSDNENLVSVSLPLGLKEIGNSAFNRCMSLVSISIPLTVTQIGENAFSDCMFLERVNMSPALRSSLSDKDIDIFDNSPLATTVQPLQGGNGSISGDRYPANNLYVIAAPENASNKLAVYSNPTEYSHAEQEYVSGTVLYVQLDTDEPDWYELADHRGYILRSQTVPCPQETLFHVTSVLPKSDNIKVIYEAVGNEEDEEDNDVDINDNDNNRQIITYRQFKKICEETERKEAAYWDETGYESDESILNDTWHLFSSMESTGHDSIGYVYIEYRSYMINLSQSCECWIGDCSVKREHTGDKRTLGLVVASESKNRVHLRKEPSRSSKSLGKYYSCTQVQIIGSSDDWYHVRVNGIHEGYMMKKYVTIAEQEP